MEIQIKDNKIFAPLKDKKEKVPGHFLKILKKKISLVKDLSNNLMKKY